MIGIAGATAEPIEESDVDYVRHYFVTDDRWDGYEAAVFCLKDGRWVSYESTYGPTGSGFSADAYGGDADVYFAPSYEEIVRWGLTDEARRDMGIEQP
jgi:hypothetical protein